jgi:predicted ATP-binding protein involved in virulence
MKPNALPDLDPAKGYLMSLTLENIRCFGSPAEELYMTKLGDPSKPARWTVILGANGVGKTTVLRALACLPTSPPIFPEYHLITREAGFMMRNSKSLAHSKIEDSLSNNYLATFQGDRDEATLWWKLTVHSMAKVAGYSVGRAWRGSREKGGSSIDTLFDRTAQVRDPSQTLADWTSYEFSNPSDKSFIVEKLKAAFVALLPDVQDVKLDHDREKRPFASFQTPNGWIGLDDMSWGYQVFAAFAADYASRLIEWYPDSQTPLAEPGICLVDELDLHMHPSWQRKVIDDLSNIFPATQFIVTVHSPLVVQAAEDANLVVLKRYPDDPSRVQIDNDVEAIKGWRIDQVLTSDLFGLESSRPPSVTDALNERTGLLAKNAPTPEEQARLDALEAQAMALPTADANWEDEARALVLRAAQRLKRGA